MRSLGRALIQYDWFPYKKKKFGHRQHTEGRLCEDREKIAIYKPKRGASKEASPNDTLILHF